MSTIGIHLSLTSIGSYLILLGNAINAAAVVVLSDGSSGSPRSIALAIGMLLSAVGAYLIARGHGSLPSPPLVQGPIVLQIPVLEQMLKASP